MQKTTYRIGPGAPSLILILVVLCMTVLGVLALASGRNDLALAERSVRMTEDYYQASSAAQETVSRLDEMLAGARAAAAGDEDYLRRVEALLPEDMALEGRTVSWIEDANSDRSLVCEIEIAPWDAPGERFGWAGHWLKDNAGWEDDLYFDLE